MKIGIVVTEYHKEITEKMLKTAQKHAKSLGAQTEVVWVPGAFEMPLAVLRLVRRKDIHGVATLGYLERGETMHGELIAKSITPKFVDLTLEYEKPISLGIIGPMATYEQAVKRTEKHAKEAIDAVVKLLK